MDILSLFRDLIIPKFVLKLQMLAFVVFIATILGNAPNLSGIVGFLLFFITYLSTYFYNDLLDLEDDKTKAVYPAKLLARGRATEKEYLFLATNLFALGVLLTALYSPLLGIVTFFAVFLNNLRSHVRSVLPRQVLLVLVEYLNFVAGWIALYSSFPGTWPSSVFLEYATLYALGHIVYKLRKQAKHALTDPVGLFFVLVAMFFAVPTLYVLSRSVIAFIFGLLGAVIYTVPQYQKTKEGDLHAQEFVDRIFWHHTAIMFLLALWFLAGALILLPCFHTCDCRNSTSVYYRSTARRTGGQRRRPLKLL